ncbi:sn-glycerol-1-phosphate dehydrogenase [Acidipropionibacterium jensenii]|uniref:Glycerol-1-phosphate dehydrogenase [NAD(P)+] n=1 Tax=Acidipropionibacterium jensenii TaxID=1749 RepID=A0A3S4VIC4_9ACTN|nr:sn-glycerol-1-phosphate dehydrogenase [Acidipropionibacterium jensenii]MDN5976214.1 sn-glycerol-1-phosphate dehydrogenase [Acidipropionibacterium jensenii]MDN5997170.1 sn-glycerol-1-phosphate dehydrogenase [Acidipropionibacterium jensenii]MDN6426263.1 sn-glycerol-1-phosphate dehydrogenase [Acidipropionibacterium jensenii]MDN6441219.1 sn-glycerol-1-phosphate dehydrogenase [Acidipropionibacterium jensenii]MDN6480075.1 sn-glycerol-1-phosphate dehydrogenase [Acidipropionibacterium jensenii]
MSELIERALADSDDTDVVVMGHGVLDQTGPVFTKLFGDAKAIIIADGNTWGVAGEAVKASLTGAGVELVEPMIFPAHPTVYAAYENVQKIRDHLAGLDGVIACSIGSGTLNDLTKRASDELGRRYMNVCTAASMDGYAAFGASITENGFKHTMSCRAPQALIADLPTMAGAPQRCTATGLGDLIEKVPAGADWIIADELGIEPIDKEVWDLVQGPLPQAISDPKGLSVGKPEALEGLVEGLVMSGLAMQKYRISSRPASGAGHQFSHTWEMEKLGMDQEPPLTHGMKVGLGTIAVLALWAEILTIDFSSLDIDAAVAKWPSAQEMEAKVRRNFTGDMLEPAVKQTMDKYLTADQLRERLELVAQKWPEIQRRCADQVMPAERVEKILKEVGGVYHPGQIGLTEERFHQTYFRCQMIRSRYTLLDFLLEAGVLQEEVDKLFVGDGFWAKRPWKH